MKELIKELKFWEMSHKLKSTDREDLRTIINKMEEQLTIPVVIVTLPNDDEIEKRAEYMQRPRNPSNDIKEEFIYGYMQGADWIINKYKPNER